MKRLACLPLLVAVSGCPDIDTDANETETAPVVEFDPGNRIIPFPNNLLIGALNGKVTLPEQCNETPTAKALREGVLNQMDGFGTYEAVLTVTFSEAVDMASLSDKIVVYKRGTDPNAATALPVITQAAMTQRFDEDCANPKLVPQVAIIPQGLLEQKSVYVVALRKGIKTAAGAEFSPSFTWRLVRTKDDPVTVVDNVVVSDLTPLNPADPGDRERLLGIDLLWNVHAGGLKFLSEELPENRRIPRDEILLAWEFKTQTTTDPLDPAVAGSPAASVRKDPLTGVIPLPGAATGGPAGETAPEFLQRVAPAGTCSLYPCSAVGNVQRAILKANRYQTIVSNPLPGMCMPPSFIGCPVAGPWTSPTAPALMEDDDLEVFIVTPSTCPAAGCPTIVFGHGLGQSKSNAFVIGARFAEQGFATVAIDAVAHGSRRVRISDNVARGCADVAGPPNDTRPAGPQCYAPFLSPNLGTTRDNIRQTVVDHHSLVSALKICNGTPCGDFKPDAARLFYVGQSLGGIMGGMHAATIADIRASVLNVPAVGWADILENTQNPNIKCPLVDGLIDAGILMGEKSNPPVNPTTGLCIGEEWKAQPGYRQFAAIGRWVLDAADPANFTRKLATRKFLIQEVDGDQVVPNIATAREGLLVGELMPGTAAPGATAPPALPPASPAITTNKRVRYLKIDPVADPPFPGNTFAHGSLLSPATAGGDGVLGTLRMQSDAINFIKNNNTP